VNRHISRGETAVDLAQRASEAALADAGLSAKDIDMIVVATVTGENIMPSTACSLQYRLGCRNNIVAFDILAACSGFVYALSIADQFIRGGNFKKILVVGSEVFTRHINYKERETCILFGDGAGAWILSASEEKENSYIMSTHLHADGEFGDLFNLKAGGT
jgi:3-oxoacyl-[acyl-carrier-protein] synthase-3